MEAFWSTALKYCGSAAIGGFVAYGIYPLLITAPILKNLNSNQLFVLLGLIAVLVFIICVFLINIMRTKPNAGNTIIVKKSKVRGGITGGNRTSGKSR